MGSCFTNNHFSVLNTLVMRISFQVLACPHPQCLSVCDFHFSYPSCIIHPEPWPSLHCLQTTRWDRAEAFSSSNSSWWRDHRPELCREEQWRLWSQRCHKLGGEAMSFGSLRRHPERPESTCLFLGALVSGGHPECNYLLQVLCEECWHSCEWLTEGHYNQCYPANSEVTLLWHTVLASPQCLGQEWSARSRSNPSFKDSAPLPQAKHMA